MSLKNLLNKSEPLVIIYDSIKQFYYKNLITDEKLISEQFKNQVGRELDLNNPVYFNDKLQWLKLNWRDPLASKCADKYEVRDFVKKTIGDQYLNKLYAVYESVDEIDIEKLPNSFVLKGTHGSGFNIICKDKRKIDWDDAFKTMRRWLRKSYYLHKREWVYKDIKPRIVCEKYLQEDNTGQLKDYKLHCFNGEPQIIQVDFDRYKGHKKNLYDAEWNFMEVEFNYPYDKDFIIERPKKLDEMIHLSRLLSKHFSYARVDFYLIDDKLIFGEITFFPASGMGKFIPQQFERQMGDLLTLPN
ncbi:ATP-grasp fold amidoligase family protein [Sutcliffiella horikoshii]|uniref:ATP-grasp fold amidoligase family protein n=1 Tax=Sutcliffiella horikoshii TaxID=79883 RepID=UPI00384C3177